MDSQYTIRKFLSQVNAGEETLARAFKFKKRDLKLGGKEREVLSLIESSKR
jgi:hypothetical protein